ncbi:hypothetical protein HMPREF2811_04565 [Globicatella sp. HMSC072A10]|uniref:hypothetical protein n=1 Tax=Globicatella sp. HMSC072A10 TaxID=1739315 RepID=UPI0008CCAFF6|nr:hypothetical protein [Globicatella sp. HMSC072A10]OFK59491.1 hypothetical protein HMPREF2811_04565 [Globicatella sp. HMSC072A10]
MILTVLYFAFPLLMLIIAGYLVYFRHELKVWLNLEDTKIIKALISAFFSMGLVGLFLTTLKYETLFIIWMILAILLTGVLTFIFVKLMK